MDTLKPKNSKSITFTVREGFFKFWAILAHSAAAAPFAIQAKVSSPAYISLLPRVEFWVLARTKSFAELPLFYDSIRTRELIYQYVIVLCR